MDALVEDVKGVICQFLDSLSLSRIARVDKLFYKLSTNDLLWKRRVDDDYNNVSKYKTCETFREQYIKLRENVKLGLTSSCMSGFKDAVMYLLTTGVKVEDHNLLYIIRMSDVDVYELPMVKPLIITSFFQLNACNITISNPAALDWLLANNIIVDERTFVSTLMDNNKDKEIDALALVNWYIQHHIQLTQVSANMAVYSNYVSVYKTLSTIGLRCAREDLYFPCVNGCVEMLDVLKSQGIMPPNDHVYKTYRDSQPEVRMSTLRWFRANGYKAPALLIKAAIKAEDLETLALFADTYKFRTVELTQVISGDRLQVFMWFHQHDIINTIKVNNRNITDFVIQNVAVPGAVGIAEYLLLNNIVTRDNLLRMPNMDNRFRMWLNGTSLPAIPPVTEDKRGRVKQ